MDSSRSRIRTSLPGFLAMDVISKGCGDKLHYSWKEINTQSVEATAGKTEQKRVRI